MMFKNSRIGLGIACLLLVLGWGATLNAQPMTHSLLATGPNGPTGGQLQIGTGLPLPGQVYTGGVSSTTAGTAFWPSLLIPINPRIANVVQTHGTTQGGAMQIQNKVVTRPGTTVAYVPTFPTNPVVFQVNTAIDYAWPAMDPKGRAGAGVAPPNLGPGMGPGTTILTFPAGVGDGAAAIYSGGAKMFGGASQFEVAPGAGSAGGVLLGFPVTVYINYLGAFPATAATMAALLGAQVGPFGQPGAGLATPTATTPGVGTSMSGFCNCSFGAGGTVLASTRVGGAGLTNRVKGSKGVPWTTGMITLTQPAAGPAEIFFLSGTDMRVGGVGNISLVSGALSDRQLSGPNANRGWVRLNIGNAVPEPTAALAAVGALGMLGLCHALVRRRSR